MSPRPQKPEPPVHNPKDLAAVGLVLHRRHWTSGTLRRKYDCKCEECQAINRVVALARKAMSADLAYRRKVYELTR